MIGGLCRHPVSFLRFSARLKLLSRTQRFVSLSWQLHENGFNFDVVSFTSCLTIKLGQDTAANPDALASTRKRPCRWLPARLGGALFSVFVSVWQREQAQKSDDAQ